MMEFYITSLLQILCFSSHFRRFEMKIFLRRPTMMAENISQLVTPPPPSLLWWTIKAKLFLRTILISKVNFFFMFYLNLKLNLKFISNSVSYRNQFKFHFILVFNFKLTSKAILFFCHFKNLIWSKWPMSAVNHLNFSTPNFAYNTWLIETRCN